jgi:rod shape determining protein RodA
VAGRRLLDNFDGALLFATLALVGLGLVAIASSTMEQPGLNGLWRTQLLWLTIAIGSGAVVFFVDYRVWGQLALALHGLVIGLLVLVLFFGREVGGNRSWLELGPLRLQPSELAKWTTCLVLSVYLAQRVRGRLRLRQMVMLGILTGLPVGLIAMQPDMGTALIFVPIFLAALLLGGVRWKVIGGFALAGVLLAPVAWTQLEDYQKARILTVFKEGYDPSGVGYQVRQSKIAIGSGGLTGKGLFQGTQSQLNFLPAQHTDFIVAVIAEELGFVGTAGLLGLFYYLCYRGVVAARSSQDRLGTYLCLLVVAWITGQMAINIGMVLGRLPTIGVPMPLISYGGSSLIAVISGIALIASVRARRFVN